MALPNLGVDPIEVVSLVEKFIKAAKSQLDSVFGDGFAQNNPVIYAQVLQIIHADYVEAVRMAQRQAEVKPAAQA